MEQNPVSTIKRDFIRNLLADGEREDGRGLMDMRDLEITADYIGKANGSALVKLGKTQVLAGVKVQVDTPYNDTPNRGNFMTSCELCPMASPYFEPGPPRIEAIELARVTDRSLRESGVIDMEALCIEPGQAVWGVFVDLHVLDYDGNLFDAASIAALAAVLGARLPPVCPKTGRVVFEDGESRPLPLRVDNATFSTTFAKIGDKVVVDPSLYEELVADARTTVGVDGSGALRAAQKGGFGSFTVDEIKSFRRTAHELGQAVMEKVEAAVKAGQTVTA